MLRVSIHAGPLAKISRFNRLDWVDIGYDSLDAYADYKIVLFHIGKGATPPIALARYPRWSGSLWDLSARAIALALSPDAMNRQEKAPDLQTPAKRYAFAGAVSAVILHYPSAGGGTRRVAEMDIVQCRSTRGFYRAEVQEDLQPDRTTPEFGFFPSYLSPAELVMRTALAALTGRIDEFPPRPRVFLPRCETIDGLSHVLIDHIEEPARTGFIRWLYDNNAPPREYAGTADGIARESDFVQFLHVAI
jgi:hypothetical protein